jgi:GNAT superfamily N-acetyltransferase
MQVREARVEDLRATEEVRVATWKVAYRGIVPDVHLDAMAVTDERVANLQSRYGGEMRTLVAEVGGAVVGMAAIGPCRDDDRPGERELYALYVLPDHWGTGAGQALWEAAQPFTSLWVLTDNPRARAFYERNGFRPDGRTMPVGFTDGVDEVRYVLG